jgi:hypothetical protein
VQEGNGLNQGLFGPVDLASTLASLLAQRGSEGRGGGGWEGGKGMVSMEEVLGERRMLAEALTELMVEDSLRRAVSEVRMCVSVCVCVCVYTGPAPYSRRNMMYMYTHAHAQMLFSQGRQADRITLWEPARVLCVGSTEDTYGKCLPAPGAPHGASRLRTRVIIGTLFAGLFVLVCMSVIRCCV